MLTRCAPLAAALFLLAGCGPPKLNETRTYDLAPLEAKALDLPSVSKTQKVTVEFSSTASELTVYLLRDSTGEPDVNAPDQAKVLASKSGKADTFAVDVPANTATRVLLRGAKVDTKVTVTVTNAK